MTTLNIIYQMHLRSFQKRMAFDFWSELAQMSLTTMKNRYILIVNLYNKYCTSLRQYITGNAGLLTLDLPTLEI